MERETKDLMGSVFSDATLQVMPVYEEEFCNFDAIPLTEIDLNIPLLLQEKTYRQGQTLSLRNKIKPETPITWIGIHNRRTDLNNYAWKKHGLVPLEEEYFVEAMDYYRERFGEAVIFLYVSDDMKWGRQNLMNPKRDLFFVGNGKTEDMDEIAFDMTILAQCNHLTAFAHLYQLREELGVDVYIVNQTRKLMSQVFSETTLQTLPVLEEEFCNIDDIPFRDFDLDIRYILTDESYRKGHILLLLDERVRHLKLNQRTKEYREFIQKFTNSMRSVLQFRPEILEAVDTKMTKIATKFRQKHPTIDQAALITWIGIHNRRTDFNNFAWQKHGLTPFEEEYFVEAMDYYRERFGEAVIFLYVSDDMKWGRLNLMNPKRDLFFVGKGKTEDEDEIAFDMTLLAQCNHSIYTRGTFGIWTAAMAGGLIHHERGVSENVVDI
eukprot:TCALIF_02225-PA protein Name:"Similar to FUT2 Galactoside 2-alpha-L-fucosyltransferase 2 (Bos taurus)" AED:0.15 eAED:0.15 QI:0/0.6/0.33/1/1/1/6/394/436